MESPGLTKPVIIHHVQKTAGTAFKHAIKKSFSADEVLVDLGDADEENHAHEKIKRDPESLKPIKIIFGHHAFHFSKYFSDPDHGIMIRHPIRRLISHYQWHRGLVDNEVIQGSPLPDPKTLSLRAFSKNLLDFAYSLAFFANGASIPNPNFMALTLHKCLNHKYETPTSSQNYENIRHLHYVGMQEHFDLSIFLLINRTAGVDLCHTFVKQNRYNQTENVTNFDFLPKWFHDELKAHLKLDFEIFNGAYEIFDEAVSECFADDKLYRAYIGNLRA